MLLKFLLPVTLALVLCEAHHILVLSPVPSKSHNALGWGIVNALLKAGHEVSCATPWAPKRETVNLNIIDISTTISTGEEMFKVVNMVDKARAHTSFSEVLAFSSNITKTALNTPALRNALTKGVFDAVVTEYFFSDFEAGYAAILNVPWILVKSIPMEPFGEALIDEVRSVPTIPNFMFNDATIPMNFYQRCKNTLAYLCPMVVKWILSSRIQSVYYDEFTPLALARGVELPEFSSALHNVSVMLVISDPSFTPAHSLPPNVVQIAGYHIDDHVPPLPKDLQELLDNSPQGVVYFSMGSILKSAAFPIQLRADLLRMFSSIKHTVLWKFEEQLEGLPPNIHIRPWMPQASILAHPNVKLFITHGGMLSHLEALQSGVPLLALPVFGDQPSNANRAVVNGYGRKVPFSLDMVQQMTVDLKEMLDNDSYLKRAQQVSRLFRNRPVPLDKLISHYVEVAVETQGAYHLRSPSKLYVWYQLWMLDQLLAALALVCVLYSLVRTIGTLVLGNTNKHDTKHINTTEKKQKRN